MKSKLRWIHQLANVYFIQNLTKGANFQDKRIGFKGHIPLLKGDPSFLDSLGAKNTPNKNIHKSGNTEIINEKSYTYRFTWVSLWILCANT